MTVEKTLTNLQAAFLADKSAYSEHFSLRIYRALSWLKKADMTEDDDTRFIALWIAFNAAYAKETDFGLRFAEQSVFMEFLNKIHNLDKDKQIYRLVWQTYAGSIRLLMENQYTFQPFWAYQNGLVSEDSWKQDFDKSKKKVLLALSSQDTHAVLVLIFQRLYTIRNQILHGGATFGSSVNRKQLADACHILSALVPAIVQVMLDNHQQVDWGKPFYPPVNLE